MIKINASHLHTHVKHGLSKVTICGRPCTFVENPEDMVSAWAYPDAINQINSETDFTVCKVPPIQTLSSLADYHLYDDAAFGVSTDSAFFAPSPPFSVPGGFGEVCAVVLASSPNIGSLTDIKFYVAGFN